MVPAARIGARSPVEAVVVGGSAGSVAALGHILPALPAQFPAVLVVVHVLPSAPSLLAELFRPRCAMRVQEAEAFETIEGGTIYFAPADYHLLVEPNRRCSLSIEPPVHFSRPSIDVLFESAAEAYGSTLLGLILTGASADGSLGLKAIDAAGGLTFVQDPYTADCDVMPRAALAAVPGANVVSLAKMATELRAWTQAT